jgi:hypothetical protein
MPSRIGSATVAILMLLIAVVLIASALGSLLASGVFTWTLQQPRIRQGFVEALILFLCLYASFYARGWPIRGFLIIFPAAIYCRRHAVDASILINYLYVQAVFNLGWLVSAKRLEGVISLCDRMVIAILAGICSWAATIWGLSFIGLGSLETLRLFSVCALGFLLLNRTAPVLALQGYRWLGNCRGMDAMVVAFLATLFFVLFAMLNSTAAVNYDSMWYGLQAEKSLLGQDGLFSGLGLVALVHYYPKLYESLLIPFSGLHSQSLPVGFSVFNWLGLVLVCFLILRKLEVPRTLALLTVALIGTVPAIAGSALTAKGDLFAALLIMTAIYFVNEFRKSGQVILAFSAFACLILAPLGRLTAIAYSPLVLLWLAAVVVRNYRLRVIKLSHTDFAVVLLGGAFFVSMAVLFRTISLAGVPFVAPAQLVQLAEMVGMKLAYPVGGDASDPADALHWSSVFVAILLQPGSIRAGMIMWTGNLWLVWLLMGFLWRKHPDLGLKWTLVTLTGLGLLFPLILSTMSVTPSWGGDGNYYIVSLACLFLAGSAMMSGVWNRQRLVISLVAWLGIISGSAIAFVTSNFAGGTRGWDLDFDRLPYELKDRSRRIFWHPPRRDLYDFFERLPEKTRVIGLYDPLDERHPKDKSLMLGWALPIRYEPVETIGWSRPEVFATLDSLKQFLRAGRVDFVVLPAGFVTRDVGLHLGENPGVAGTQIHHAMKMLHQTIAHLESQSMAEKTLSNERYEIWKIGPLARP